jgi:hypothetical protein
MVHCAAKYAATDSIDSVALPSSTAGVLRKRDTITELEDETGRAGPATPLSTGPARRSAPATDRVAKVAAQSKSNTDDFVKRDFAKSSLTWVW